MNRAALYSQAAHPEPYTILGLRLKPFSLQHYLLMSRFDVAFVAEDSRDATIDDLITGVLICSRHWNEGEFEDYLCSASFDKEMEQWGAKIGLFNPTEKFKLFADYIAEGSEVPKYWEEETGKQSGAHWSQAILLCLTGELGYSRKEALLCPLKQALADFFKHAENNGLIRLMTPEEIEMIEAAEKEAANANA